MQARKALATALAALCAAHPAVALAAQVPQPAGEAAFFTAGAPLQAGDALVLPEPGAPLALPSAPPRWLHKGASGSLVLTSRAQGAKVTIDGAVIGQVPLPALKLAPGKHALKLEQPGFATLEKKFVVRPGQKTALTANLVALPPALAPLSLPPAAAPSAVAEEEGPSRPAAAVPDAAESLQALVAAVPPPAQPPAELPQSEVPPAELSPPAQPPSAVLPPAAPPPLVLANGELATDARALVRPAPVAALAATAPVAQAGTPLTRKWWFWGGAAVAAAVVVAGVTLALPASYTERRDAAAACGGTCGIVINK